jgi:hypothetical protein
MGDIIIFCVIGDNFSGQFMTQMINLITNCFANNYRPILSIRNDNNIYHAYNRIIGANIADNKLELFADNKDLGEYKAIIFIDKDITVTFREIERLIKSEYPITAAFCTNNNTPIVTNFIIDNKFVMEDDMYNLDKIDNRYIEAKYVTFDTIAFKYGVFEMLTSTPFTMGNHQIYDPEFTLLDTLRKYGQKIMIDTNTRNKMYK